MCAIRGTSDLVLGSEVNTTDSSVRCSSTVVLSEVVQQLYCLRGRFNSSVIRGSSSID